MNPKEAYDDLGLRNKPMDDVLSDEKWIRWAYLVCELSHHFEENYYKLIVKAMSAIYGAEALAKILTTAANAEKRNSLAINLAKVANDRIKHLLIEQNHELASILIHQEQHTAKQIYEFRRSRIFAFLRAHVEDNTLSKETFYILTSYLSVLLNKEHAVGTELSISHRYSKDAVLLQKLLSLKNFYRPGHLQSLVSFWFDKKVPPSKIVSMLVQDRAKADHFAILFSNGLSDSFWLHYVEMYNCKNLDLRTANSSFGQLVQLLFAVVEQEAPAAFKYAAYSTILKMLISPSTAHLSSSYEYMVKLITILLWNRTLPSDILSMLMRGEADADKFNLLFVNKSSKSFWVRFLKMYNRSSENVKEFAHTANTDFQLLLTMLHDVRVPESSTAMLYMAKSVILKILLSPEITNVVTSHDIMLVKAGDFSVRCRVYAGAQRSRSRLLQNTVYVRSKLETLERPYTSIKSSQEAVFFIKRNLLSKKHF